MDQVEGKATELLTPQETAALLKVSIHTLASWRRSNGSSDLPHVDVGGAIRYLRSDLEAWIQQHRNPAA